MKTLQPIKWMCASAALTLLVATPVIADDTELLLLNPNTSEIPKPNILFILDSSGSMTTNQNDSKVLYDSDRIYDDLGCDNDYLYWTPVDAVPSCDAANTRKILKASFRCEDATRQLKGIGTYTDQMVQWRIGGSGFFSVFFGLDKWRWQQLEPGNGGDLVECKSDSGEAGAGEGDNDFVKRGGTDNGDIDNAYTNDESLEVSWGSWPTSQTITVYDGNYLNYRLNPETETARRTDIMRDVTKAVLSSVDDVNVGIMRFNGSEGGVVIQGITDLDTNRATIDAAIDAVPAGGNTPLAETLYESARYWRGLSLDYADGAAVATDPAIVTAGGYNAPTSNSCTKNFNVMLSDGNPVSDNDFATTTPALPDWATTLGRTVCTGPTSPNGGVEQGQCLADIAEYLFNGDIAPGAPGVQTVTTHTIGFVNDIPTLEETARRGGGDYFRADDVESLTLALLQIVNNITDRSLSFAAPAVAVNSFNRTRNLNDLYLTTFGVEQNLRWPGNLKKFRIVDGEIVDQNNTAAVDPTTGFFSNAVRSFWSDVQDGNDVRKGGAANELPSPINRNVYTNITTNPDLTDLTNGLKTNNLDRFTLADFGLTGSPEEPTMEQLIDWARGVDVTDEFPESEVRNEMGDPLHSQPAAVVYGGSEASPDVVVYTATNEGYVHAVDGATGEELWSFVPKEFLPNLSKLFFNPAAQYKNYGVDGDIVPVVYDKDGDGEIEPLDDDFVYILFGMRRGGNAYYALDVTNKTSPKVLWRLSASSFGQSWSAPTIARVDIDGEAQNALNAVAVIGGGYDTVHDSLPHPAEADATGNGVYFIDIESGNIVWRAGPDTEADRTIEGMTRSIATQIRVVDLTGDGFADRMYASDMGGQIFRFDIFNGKDDDNVVTGGVIAQLGAEGAATVTDENTRRFYTAPDISVFNDPFQNRRFIAVSIGSGYRARPLTNTPVERFYSLRDPDIFNPLTQDDYNNYDVITEATLVDVQGQVRTQIDASKDGWMLTLPEDQKVLEESVTFNNEVFFVGFSPGGASADCSAGVGNNFLYRVSIINGDPIVPNIADLAAADADAERSSDLGQKGIAPSPQFLFPTAEADCTGAACNPPPLGCVGVECFDPGFNNVPVRTLWTQDGIQ